MIRLAVNPTPNPFGWFSPDISKLPGGGTLQDLSNGLGGFVLVVLVVGLLLAAGAWVLGVGIGNIQYAERGKQGTIAACVVALLIGALHVLLAFFYSVGQGLH
jgi:hypothetical protein